MLKMKTMEAQLMTDIVEQVLEERGARYGAFERHAVISQNLKDVLRVYNDNPLSADQREALEMILHKVARIINGDPDYPDNWVDIAGYATLVANRLGDTDE